MIFLVLLLIIMGVVVFTRHAIAGVVDVTVGVGVLGVGLLRGVKQPAENERVRAVTAGEVVCILDGFIGVDLG